MEKSMQKSKKTVQDTDYIFSIYDNVAEHYEPPFVEKNKGTAIRRIQDLIQNNPQSPYAKFPDNFELSHIGYFDNMDGSILDIEKTQVIQLVQLIEPKQE